MKPIFSFIAVIITAGFFLTTTVSAQNPQEKKVKKHIKMLKIDDDGNKTELDTILEGENVFIWNGDTIGGDHAMKWHGDSSQVFKFRIEDDGDDEDHDILFWKGKEGNEMIMHAPEIPSAPRIIHAPGVMQIRKKIHDNVIDLSDPGVISFRKKDMKDGKEKITIIRKKPETKEKEIHEEVIIHGGKGIEHEIHKMRPGKPRKIKVIKEDDGNVEIIEEDGSWDIGEGSVEEKVITKDGKVIHIREIGKGDKKNIEVTIKEEKEEK